MRKKVSMTYRIRFLLCWFFISGWLGAQNLSIGILPVRNYEKAEYHAGTQNWDIAIDDNDVVYFANNLGLLQFDGTYWQLLPISNKTIVRSLKIGDDGRIYVGGQGEFGYFFPQANGTLKYHSLTPLVPEDKRDFADIWDIEITEDGVFFRANEIVFKLYGDHLEAFTFNNFTRFMGKMGDRILLQTGLHDIRVYQSGNFVKTQSIPELTESITGILSSGDTWYLTTGENGIFKFENDQWRPFRCGFDPFLAKGYAIYTSTTLPDGRFAVSCPPYGILIFDQNWQLNYIADKKKNLQNNTPLALCPDRRGNLWVGQDNGIDYFEVNAPIRHIFPDGEVEGTGYTACIHRGELFLGTNSGLYVNPNGLTSNPLKTNNFEFIEGSRAQVWSVQSIGDHVFFGHHSGAYEVTGRKARLMNDRTGTWIFIPLNDHQILAGQYTGLALFERQNGIWQFSQKLSGLRESSRILIRDDLGVFWMSHPYRGIYKITPDLQRGQARYTFYNAKNGLPSDQLNYVFKVKGKALFTGETGVFEFDPETETFHPYEPFHRFFAPETHIKTLREDDNGNVWFATENEVGVLQIRESGLERDIQKVIFPELKDKLVGGFEFIYPIDNQRIIFGAEKGFILLNPQKYTALDTSIRVILSEVRLMNKDSVLYAGQSDRQGGKISGTTLSADQNNLVFQFSAPVYGSEKQVLYQTKLEGLDKEWSPWSPKTSREITNLPAGGFTFRVRAKNGLGTVSPEVAFAIEIIPPWYARPTAQIIFGLCFIGLILGVLYMQKNKFESEKAQLESVHLQKEAEHQQVVKKTAEEINRLQTEKLEAEIGHKTKELALATMHLVQKNKMLARIQRELEKIATQKTLPAKAKSDIRQIINLLKQDQILDEEWNQFEVHFDQVHGNFLKRLREKYPQLSPNDYRLCAYLRMNLSTKEIAPLLNISVRGVEASRYRLRRKLNLNSGENLIEFIMNV
ncbi:MAG: hypothetical protein D6714_16170 [Bacteroidetes bacterium]|nr:MAG: hypothetical protein D6714_16170 [Bacteroidota bacterium]